MSDPAYLHELRGQYTGLAVGRQEGFAAGQDQGYTAGWNDAMREVTPRFEALQQERDAYQRDRDNIAYAANAMGVIARAMQAVIVKGTRDQQLEVINRYNELVDQLIVHGSLRCPPHLDATVQERESDVANFLPQLAERLNSADDDYSP